jgi:hypothetical protein
MYMYSQLLYFISVLLVYPENGIGSWKKENIDGSIKKAYEKYLDGRYNFTPLL